MTRSTGTTVTINLGAPLALLGLAMFIAKVLGLVTWSWWVVLSPFWVMPVLFLAILFVPVAIATLLGLVGLVGVCTIWAVAAIRDRCTKRAR